MAIIRQGRSGTYRRRKGRNAAVIIVFMLCLAAFAWYMMSESFVFTADGIKLPWLKGDEEKETQSTSADVTINTQADKTENTSKDTTHAETPKSIKISGFWITAANLADEKYVDSLIAQGINQVVFTIKDKDGVVNIPFTSSLNLPEKLVSKQAEDIAGSIKKLKDNDVYIIGTISALRDGMLAKNYKSDVIQTGSGVTWLDRDNITWFKPTSKIALQYTNELSQAAKSLGIDSILLTNLSYPTLGKTDLIGKADAPLSDSITAFAKEAVKTDMPYMVLCTTNLGEERTGQSIQELEKIFSKLAFADTKDGVKSLPFTEKVTEKEKLLYVVGTKDEGLGSENYIYTK